MGQERDIPEAEKTGKNRHFSDDEICKYHLCGVPVYEMFRNTKSDLGNYDKVYDDDCQAEFQALSQSERERYGYEYDTFRFLEHLCDKLDRTIQRHKQRVSGSTTEAVPLSEVQKAQVEELRQKIHDLHLRAEAVGEQGDVDGSLQLVDGADKHEKQVRGGGWLAVELSRVVTVLTRCLACPCSPPFHDAARDFFRLSLFPSLSADELHPGQQHPEAGEAAVRVRDLGSVLLVGGQRAAPQRPRERQTVSRLEGDS